MSPSGNETGEYGFSDFVNPADKNACPNNVLDAGEDLDGLGSPTGFFTYGEISFPSPAAVASVFADGSSLNATVADPNCPTGSAGINPWPGTYLVYPNEGRQNPPSLFRQRRQRNPKRRCNPKRRAKSLWDSRAETPLQNSQAGQRYQPAVESPPPFDSLSLARERAGARRGAAESS